MLRAGWLNLRLLRALYTDLSLWALCLQLLLTIRQSCNMEALMADSAELQSIAPITVLPSDELAELFAFLNVLHYPPWQLA